MVKRDDIETVSTATYEFDAIDLLPVMIANGIFPKGTDQSEVRIYFRVPGGGDWSGVDIDISKHHPLIVEHKTRKRGRV